MKAKVFAVGFAALLTLTSWSVSVAKKPFPDPICPTGKGVCGPLKH